MNLTPKQEAFCQAHIETGNASEAYRRAYNAENMKPETVHRTAKEMLDNPKISARLEELMAGHLERHKLTVDTVLEGLLKEARHDGDGSTHSARVQAWTQLGKHLAMFTDKQELTGKDGGPIETKDKADLKELPTDVLTELRAIATRIDNGDKESTTH